MTNASPDCPACKSIAASAGSPSLVYADELWVLRHSGSPYPAAGWMLMHSRRHMAGAAYFNEREAADFGPALQRFSRAILDATGALRIYVASLTEATPHFHCHLVPRYQDGPVAWAAFNDLARAREGLVEVDAKRVAEIIRACRATLAVHA